MTSTSNTAQRTVMAPPPSPLSAKMPANRVVSVIVQADEDVEWVWSSTAEGVKYVSGYNKIKHRR
jgi:hypothetical protein